MTTLCFFGGGWGKNLMFSGIAVFFNQQKDLQTQTRPFSNFYILIVATRPVCSSS